MYYPIQSRWMRHAASVLAATVLMTGCEKPEEEETNSLNEADMQKISETMGHQVIENLYAQNITIDIESFIKGIEGAKAGKEPPLTKNEFFEMLSSYRKKAFDLKSSENLKIAEDFLEDNKSDPAVILLENGKIQYKILEQGNGEIVSEDASPLIHYEGKFIDGNRFDSTEKRGKPIPLSLKSTIPGFKKGVAGMKEGEKRRLFIHPDLGYGERGRLPPNSLLIFDIEIVEAGAQKSEHSKQNADQEDDGNTGMTWLKRWTGS
jgi:peptidylprolyl isomerase